MKFAGGLSDSSLEEVAMSLPRCFTSLVPPDLAVERIDTRGETILITASARRRGANCPSCHCEASRIHSRYLRKVLDLPWSGRSVRLLLTARRFRCDQRSCQQQIFAERFGDGVAAARARRTGRVDCLVHHLGLALGGRPAASIAERLMVPVSNDTLLRVVRRRARPHADPLRVVGIDDWAFRRNHRYGSIVCDLERRRVVALLPDREVGTVTAWLSQHPEIEVVSRDRGGGYGEATAKALPCATQVADRWHLMENASAAFLDAVQRSMKPIRAALGATTVNLALLTSAERLQYEGHLRRQDANALVCNLLDQGIAIKEVVRRTGRSRKLVRQLARGERADIFRTRQGSLDPHLPYLDTLWEAGCRNAAELWRRLRAEGFQGSLRVVGEWATRRRRSERSLASQHHRPISARTVARLMIDRDHLTKADAVTVAAIEAGVPTLAEAHAMIMRFQMMIRARADEDLDPWIRDAEKSLIASFARGIMKDKAAVRAAIKEPWSNGQTEGHVNRLKLIKRQMYGRAKLDLIEARLRGAA
jgi:transposase